MTQKKMLSNSHSCSCAPTINWLRDTDQVFLLDTESGQYWSIRGIEMAMWDFMTLAYPYEKIVRFLSLFLETSPAEAEKVFITTLCNWQEVGIIQITGEQKRDQSGN
jgi:hypothetical protein